jgi:type IV secretion system protein VirB6
MLLLYEVALAMFIGLGPLFILSLLFDQTKALFSRWLYYGIGTLFSMAVLSAMVSIALEMVARVAAAFWATALVGIIRRTEFTEGITSQAMQQGGVGLILTVLIVSAPPMAAMFFQGTLGNFMGHSQVTGAHAASQSAQAARGSGSIPTNSSGPAASESGRASQADVFLPYPRAPEPVSGARGAALRGPVA